MICDSIVFLDSYLIHYDNLFQNVADIITNETTILLQNAIKVYYKMHQVVYYKMHQIVH